MSSFAGDWPHLLLVCGQNRVFYLDYVSYALREIEMSQLDSKEVICMEAFALEDFVAFGCSDGAVRLWHVLTGAVTKLATNSSKPIVGMFSHYSEMGSFLTVVSEDGIFTKWRVPSHADPVVEIKEGKGNYEVLDMTFDSTEHTLILTTDKGVVVRDYYNNKELNRLKISPAIKTSYISLKYFAHTKFSGSSTLALAKDGKSLAICNTQPPTSPGSLLSLPTTTSTDIDPYTILESADFPRGDKDNKVKMLYFDVHPTNASLVFIATTNGLVSASIDPFSTPQFALIRSDTLGTTSTSTTSGSSLPPPGPRLTSKTSSNSLQSQPASVPSKVFFVNEGQIWNIASAGANERGAVVSFPSLFVTLPAGSGDVQIATSPSGQYLSVFYEKLYKYEIFSVETKKVIDTASRVLGLVWCQSKEGPKMVKLKDVADGTAPKSGSTSARSTADAFAFLEGPPSVSTGTHPNVTVTIASGFGSSNAAPGATSGATTSSSLHSSSSSVPGGPLQPGGSSASGSSTTMSAPKNVVNKILGRASESVPAAQPTSRKITLNVKKTGNATHETVASFEAPMTSQPRLFPGPLLGIDVKSEPGASASISQAGSNFMFYSWSGEKVGVPMPTPLDVTWDYNSMKYCLFTYESHFCVFSVAPRFKLLAKVSDLILSSLWFNGCLFYTTRTDVKCFFASAIDSREAVMSATPTDAFTSSLLARSQQMQENLNGCSLVELTNDKLVLLTHDYRIVTVIIDNPLAQVYILAHAGKVAAAVQLANSLVPAKHHAALARFLEARGRVDAAGQLSLTPYEKLQLYLRHSNLTEALEIFSAMVKQCRLAMNAEHDIVDEDDESSLQATSKTLQTRQLLASAAHRLARAAVNNGNAQLIGKVWERLSRIEPTAYRHLALFYAQNGFTNQLQDLYKKLSAEANRDPAIKEEIKYVAVHISNKLLSDSLLNASNSYAEYILSLHETPEKEAELVETWNARIQTETDPDTLLSGLSGSSASTSISFSSIMKTSDSKDKSRSGGMMW